MGGGLDEAFDGFERKKRHPVVETIEDVITFRLQMLVTIGDRAGHQWAERLFNISLNEWRLLALIKARAPSRAGDLADLLLMDKSQASRVIKSLLSKGLVQNTPDPTDGRAIALDVTEEGTSLFERVFEEVMNSNERILSALTRDEVLAFDTILEKLVGHTKDLLERRMGRTLIR